MESNKILLISGGVVTLFVSGLILKLAKPVLFPFFLALFLSYILAPVLNLFDRFKVPKALSIIALLLVTFLVLYLLGAVFYSSGKSFASALPGYAQRIQNIVAALQVKFKFEQIHWEPLAFLSKIDSGKIVSFVLSAIGPFFSFLSNLLLIFVFLLFILAGRGRARAKIHSSFTPARADQINAVINKIDREIQKYLAIKTLISLANGILVTTILLIFGVEFAVVFGFLAFILNFIPSIGSIIATALPVVIAFFQFDRIWIALWILIILIGLDTILGNFIEPKLMGQGLGLSPLLVIFALIFWGWLWGIAGMILAIPIIAIIKIVCSNIPSLRFVAALMSE